MSEQRRCTGTPGTRNNSPGRRTGSVTSQDAEWLAGHLRALIMTCPTQWAATEMTLSQLTALHFIRAQAPVTLAGLAEELGTRPPATCAMVDRLTRAGLVCRTPDPRDHRRVQVSVTSKAEPMIGDVDLDTARRMRAVLVGMRPAARRYLLEALGETARRLSG